MKKIIEVNNLCKNFDKYRALDKVTFSVKEGEIFGFLGPSGAGKTTTIKILIGTLTQDSGVVSTLGIDPKNFSSKERGAIGIVTDDTGFYEKMTLYDNLILYSKLYKQPISEVDEMLELVGLYDFRNMTAQKLSTGMKQRMLLLRALINHPKLLFLDEPTSGLDPVTSKIIHELLIKLKNEGTTIFLTTHDMNEATLLCDRISLMNNGKLIESGTIKSLVAKYNTNKTVKVVYENSESCFDISEITGLINISKITSIHSCEPTLEDIFLKITGGTLNA